MDRTNKVCPVPTIYFSAVESHGNKKTAIALGTRVPKEKKTIAGIGSFRYMKIQLDNETKRRQTKEND